METHIIVINGPNTLSEVDAAITQLVGPGQTFLDGKVHELDNARLGVFPSDYENEPGLPLAQYEYAIQIDGRNNKRWAQAVLSAISTEWNTLHFTVQNGATKQIIPSKTTT